MKHVRADQTFVYYYAVVWGSGELFGLRFSRRTVGIIRGRDDNPEELPVGGIVTLPIGPDDPEGELYEAVQAVIEDHPEVADLLYQRKTLEEVVR